MTKQTKAEIVNLAKREAQADLVSALMALRVQKCKTCNVRFDRLMEHLMKHFHEVRP